MRTRVEERESNPDRVTIVFIFTYFLIGFWSDCYFKSVRIQIFLGFIETSVLKRKRSLEMTTNFLCFF